MEEQHGPLNVSQATGWESMLYSNVWSFLDSSLWSTLSYPVLSLPLSAVRYYTKLGCQILGPWFEQAEARVTAWADSHCPLLLLAGRAIHVSSALISTFWTITCAERCSACLTWCTAMVCALVSHCSGLQRTSLAILSPRKVTVRLWHLLFLLNFALWLQ